MLVLGAWGTEVDTMGSQALFQTVSTITIRHVSTKNTS